MTSTVRSASVFVPTAVVVIAVSILFMRSPVPHGFWVLGLGVCVFLTSVLVDTDLRSMLPDLIFGAIDTSILAVFALSGGFAFGVAGAIVGGVVGDALSDGIAGFFEGGLSELLERKGVKPSRTALGSSLGKMSGCLIGCGLVLVIAWIAGIDPRRIVTA